MGSQDCSLHGTSSRTILLSCGYISKKDPFLCKTEGKPDEDGREEESGADSALRPKIQLGKPETTNKVKLFVEMQKR